jgi:hypothetical protein
LSVSAYVEIQKVILFHSFGMPIYLNRSSGNYATFSGAKMYRFKAM